MNANPALRANGPMESPGPKGGPLWWRGLIRWLATPLGWTAAGLAVVLIGTAATAVAGGHAHP